MDEITLEYKINGGLKAALIVATEVENEMDITPTYITSSDGSEIEYDRNDAIEVKHNKLSAEKYREKHLKK